MGPLARPPGSPARLHCEVSPKRTPQTGPAKRATAGAEGMNTLVTHERVRFTRDCERRFEEFRMDLATAVCTRNVTEKRHQQNAQQRAQKLEEAPSAGTVLSCIRVSRRSLFGGRI